MTQDDVIKLAREAGLYQDINVSFHQALKNFYNFAAAHEREACAQLAEEWLGPSKDKEIHIAKAIRARGEQA